ncbi:uncharacterized protein LOC124879637 isoform X2 [Girardinichthys multiradiatus]|uniref:uncharacterized protein LOC124879637 isoform X2 n=1 Tax=Girardinichthys multiradiatus TaxID=208333 RepID=UPI001FADBBE4|nr:uncharacterized protein LOC124879637 isoform X2 [Girardinichthys multiradiatus]
MIVWSLPRFREELVAVLADIHAMFHQVWFPHKHVNFLRFIWWPNGDANNEPQEYRMRAHLFGAVSSPSYSLSYSNYALRRTTEDNACEYSIEVISTVKCSFYVDHRLKSATTEEDAVQLIHGLTSLCKRRGFHLQKWVSNSREVLALIPSDFRAADIKEMDLDRNQLPLERVLGMEWCVEGNTLSFRTAVQDHPHMGEASYLWKRYESHL